VATHRAPGRPASGSPAGEPKRPARPPSALLSRDWKPPGDNNNTI